MLYLWFCFYFLFYLIISQSNIRTIVRIPVKKYMLLYKIKYINE